MLKTLITIYNLGNKLTVVIALAHNNYLVFVNRLTGKMAVFEKTNWLLLKITPKLMSTLRVFLLPGILHSWNTCASALVLSWVPQLHITHTTTPHSGMALCYSYNQLVQPVVCNNWQDPTHQCMVGLGAVMHKTRLHRTLYN